MRSEPTLQTQLTRAQALVDNKHAHAINRHRARWVVATLKWILDDNIDDRSQVTLLSRPPGRKERT